MVLWRTSKFIWKRSLGLRGRNVIGASLTGYGVNLVMLIILARALIEGELNHANHQASEMLVRAQRLIDETGAMAYQALLSGRQPSTV